MKEHSDFSDFERGGDPLPVSVPGDVRRPTAFANTLGHIRRRFRLIVECIVIGGGLSIAAGVLIRPTFTATALLAVAEADGAAPSQTTDAAVDTQIAMLQSQAFLERAFQALTADPALQSAASSAAVLERRMKVLQSSKSRLIAVSFSAKSPTVAADAINKIVRLYVEDPMLQSVESVDDVTIQYAARIQALEAQLAAATKTEPGEGAADAPLAVQESLREQIATLKLNETLARRRRESRRQNLAAAPPVQLVALATPPMRRSSLSPLFIIGPGTLFSALFGIALAAALGRLDNRVYTREQLEALIGRECVGEIPPVESRKGKHKPSLAYLRAIEALVTQTLLLSSPRPHLVLLAPSDVNALGSSIARDFAAAAARVIPRVVLVDLDLSRCPTRLPLLKRVLGKAEKSPHADVFDILAARRPLESVLERNGARNYAVLPLKTPIVDDPFSLIASDRLQRLIDSLYRAFDLVLIEGPPMGAMYETRLLASHADAVVLFARSGASREPATRAAFEAASRRLGHILFDGKRRVWAALVDAPVDSTLAEPALSVGGVAPQHLDEVAAAVALPHEPSPASAKGLLI